MADVDVLLWDIGGVLLSNGWDEAARRAGAAEFGYDLAGYERRHAVTAPLLERGTISLDDYLERTVADPSIPRDRLRAYVLAASTAHPATIALAQTLAATGRWTMAALNNEGRDLNEHRIRTFGLDGFLSAFFSSCYTGYVKPEPGGYRLAAEVLHRAPERCLFIDDRPENLVPASELGMATILYRSPELLAADLAARGIRA